MKNSILLFTLLLLTTFINSCDKKNDSKKSSEKSAIKVPQFTFDADIYLEHGEFFILFYIDGTQDWFNEKQAIWSLEFVPNADYQELHYQLPEGQIPLSLRLDVGSNDFKEKPEFGFKKVKLVYGKKSFTVYSQEIEEYFKPNSCLKYNPESKKYKMVKNEKGEFDPIFEPTEKLIQKLAEITSK